MSNLNCQAADTRLAVAILKDEIRRLVKVLRETDPHGRRSDLFDAAEEELSSLTDRIENRINFLEFRGIEASQRRGAITAMSRVAEVDHEAVSDAIVVFLRRNRLSHKDFEQLTGIPASTLSNRLSGAVGRYRVVEIEKLLAAGVIDNELAGL